ncbi:MAG: tetratricopeptide repeat protein [Oligoflexus sp.]|nr:tetratricopeptide repeat protein [Oligoflexus sp.]
MEDNSSAIILTKRPEIRDVVRQALKAKGMKADNIFPVMDDKECLKKLGEIEYGLLILDWEFAPDKVQLILNSNRKEHRLESHLVFLIAAHDEEAIVKVAQEYYVNYIAVGEISTDTIRDQIKGLMKDFNGTGPLRKMLLAVDSCRKNGDHTNALEMLEKLHSKQPDHERIGIELAEAYIHEDRWNLAEDILRTLLSAEDVSPRVKHLFARCRLKAGDLSTAIASLKGAQLLSPYNVERLLEMGNLFLKLDRLDDAESSFAEILDFAPNSKQAVFGKSTTKLLMGEVNDALQILNGIANPRELSAIFNTAAILAIKQQRFDAGFALYQKALQLLAKKPKLVARILYNLGIGYVKQGRNDKGLKCFEKAVEQDPAYQDAVYNVKVLKTAPASGSSSASLKESSDLMEAVNDVTDGDIPLMELGYDHAEEEVELDEVLSNISKVG